MTYRLTLHADAERLAGHFGVTRVDAYRPLDRERSPTETIAAIHSSAKERVLDEFRWGLLPFWAKSSVQADGLSILANKSFHGLLKRNRCVIPCSLYCRFVPERGRRKEERILLHSGGTLAMAGVYDVLHGTQGELLRTCTILSVRTAAPERDEDVPMLLNERQMEAWLSTDYMEKRAIADLLETIADAQPKSLPHLSDLSAEKDKSGLRPFPA